MFFPSVKRKGNFITISVLIDNNIYHSTLYIEKFLIFIRNRTTNSISKYQIIFAS